MRSVLLQSETLPAEKRSRKKSQAKVDKLKLAVFKSRSPIGQEISDDR